MKEQKKSMQKPSSAMKCKEIMERHRRKKRRHCVNCSSICLLLLAIIYIFSTFQIAPSLGDILTPTKNWTLDELKAIVDWQKQHHIKQHPKQQVKGIHNGTFKGNLNTKVSSPFKYN
jgi:predicted nucleic acid-binding Zn ribbon protein